MKTKTGLLFALNLRLFDSTVQSLVAGRADAGAAKSDDAAQTGDDKNFPSAAGKGKRAGIPLSQVKYGKHDDNETKNDIIAAAKDTASDNGQNRDAAGNISTTAVNSDLNAKKAEFEKLINSDYKDLFTERVQGIIDKRFKETKNLEAQLERLSPVIEILSSKYGVPTDDIDKLSKAIQDDDSYYEDEAAQKGLTVEQLKKFKKMERENAELKRAHEEFQRRQNADRIYADWIHQSEQVKQIYPSFDLNDEIQNPSFLKLLKSGVDVKAAYQAVHMDDILGGAMQYTAQKIQQQTVNSIKARANRPTENGLSSQTGVVVKNDVSKLTAADRREIARRVQFGEHIKF